MSPSKAGYLTPTILETHPEDVHRSIVGYGDSLLNGEGIILPVESVVVFYAAPVVDGDVHAGTSQIVSLGRPIVIVPGVYAV